MIWLRIIAAAGALQGAAVLLSVLFRLKHGKNLPLALLITALSLRLILIPVWNPDVLAERSWLWPLTLPLSLLFSPLVLRHIKDLLSSAPEPPSALLRQCIPWLAGVLLVSILVISVRTAGTYESFIDGQFSGRPPGSLVVLNILIFLCNCVYLFLVVKTAFGGEVKRLSPGKGAWMKSLALILLIVLLSLGALDFLPGAALSMPAGKAGADLVLSVIISLFIFMISFFLMALPELINLPENFSSLQDPEPMEHECRILIERLEKRMDEGVFRNPDLSLTDLAAEFGVHPNLLSHAVNHYCGLGFRSYLNRKRLDCFERQLLDEADSDRSLLEMAFDSGFHSKSTFNRVFREETGLSPSQFAKKKKKA